MQQQTPGQAPDTADTEKPPMRYSGAELIAALHRNHPGISGYTDTEKFAALSALTKLPEGWLTPTVKRRAPRGDVYEQAGGPEQLARQESARQCAARERVLIDTVYHPLALEMHERWLSRQRIAAIDAQREAERRERVAEADRQAELAKRAYWQRLIDQDGGHHDQAFREMTAELDARAAKAKAEADREAAEHAWADAVDARRLDELKASAARHEARLARLNTETAESDETGVLNGGPRNGGTAPDEPVLPPTSHHDIPDDIRSLNSVTGNSVTRPDEAALPVTPETGESDEKQALNTGAKNRGTPESDGIEALNTGTPQRETDTPLPRAACNTSDAVTDTSPNPRDTLAKPGSWLRNRTRTRTPRA